MRRRRSPTGGSTSAGGRGGLDHPLPQLMAADGDQGLGPPFIGRRTGPRTVAADRPMVEPLVPRTTHTVQRESAALTLCFHV
jgi:hypothetical protein